MFILRHFPKNTRYYGRGFLKNVFLLKQGTAEFDDHHLHRLFYRANTSALLISTIIRFYVLEKILKWGVPRRWVGFLAPRKTVNNTIILNTYRRERNSISPLASPRQHVTE